MNEKISFQETTNLFNLESEKLENLVEVLSKSSQEFPIPKIVEVYYQIINVTSLMKLLQQSLETENSEQTTELQDKIKEIQKLISAEFNHKLHIQIMKYLQELIASTMKDLKSARKGQHEEKTKESVEQEAQSYEKLREIMSTKEFVEQYDKGL